MGGSLSRASNGLPHWPAERRLLRACPCPLNPLFPLRSILIEKHDFCNYFDTEMPGAVVRKWLFGIGLWMEVSSVMKFNVASMGKTLLVGLFTLNILPFVQRASAAFQSLLKTL